MNYFTEEDFKLFEKEAKKLGLTLEKRINPPTEEELKQIDKEV